MDPAEKAREAIAKLKVTFPILSDAKRAAMETYGTCNPDHEPAEDPINTPTGVLIDTSGTVRWIYQAKEHPGRVPVTKVLAAARKLR